MSSFTWFEARSASKGVGRTYPLLALRAPILNLILLATNGFAP
jgi:hypothetical protein